MGAIACPHCGARYPASTVYDPTFEPAVWSGTFPTRKSRPVKILLVVVVALIVLSFVHERLVRTATSSASSSTRWNYVPAYVICQEAVTERLKSPATAKFALPPEL